MRSFLLSALVFVAATLNHTASAEEKNGLSVTVSKTTLERSDTRNTYYYSDRIDRTQGLKVTVKNVSFKDMPEGEIEWTILVRKYYSTTVLKHSGKEKLKPLAARRSDGHGDWLGANPRLARSQRAVERQDRIPGGGHQGGKETSA
jgi:hypothetical protein